MTTDGVKVRIDPPQGHNPMGSRSGSTHLKVTTRWGQGQDRPTSRSQPDGVKVRIDPPQDHNRWGQGQDRPTSRSQPMGSRSGVSPKTDSDRMDILPVLETSRVAERKLRETPLSHLQHIRLAACGIERGARVADFRVIDEHPALGDDALGLFVRLGEAGGDDDFG